MERPYKFIDDDILSVFRLNQFSKQKMIDEYLKLGEVLKTSRKYSGSLHVVIGGYKRILRVRRYRRKAVFNRRRFKVAYLRKVMFEKAKREIKRHKILLEKKSRAKIRALVKQKVAVKVERAKKIIPRRIARARKLMFLRNKKRLHLSWQKMVRRIKSIQRRHYDRKLHRVRATVKENQFIAVVRKQKLPAFSRGVGIYTLLVQKTAKLLDMRLDDTSFLIWFGTYEAFNVGTLELAYPGLDHRYIRKKVNRFVRFGYLQGIGTFRGRKNYTFTHIGKECYSRIIRYMKKFKHPGQGQKFSKKRYHISFRKRKTSAGS